MSGKIDLDRICDVRLDVEIPDFRCPVKLIVISNVELGNKELSQAIQRNSSSRTFLLLFLFVLTFSILFLDWYN